MKAKTPEELLKMYKRVGSFTAEEPQLAWAEAFDGKFLHIHVDGTPLGAPVYSGMYDFAGDFVKGKAKVRIGGQDFIIDTANQTVD